MKYRLLLLLLFFGSTAFIARANTNNPDTKCCKKNDVAGGVFHSEKAKMMINALNNWLRSHPAARPGDRAAAENVLRDLQNALAGNDLFRSVGLRIYEHNPPIQQI